MRPVHGFPDVNPLPLLPLLFALQGPSVPPAAATPLLPLGGETPSLLRIEATLRPPDRIEVLHLFGGTQEGGEALMGLPARSGAGEPLEVAVTANGLPLEVGEETVQGLDELIGTAASRFHAVRVPFGPGELVSVRLATRVGVARVPYLEAGEVPFRAPEAGPLLVPYNGLALDLRPAAVWPGGPAPATVQVESDALPHLLLLRPEGWTLEPPGARYEGTGSLVEAWAPDFETEALVPGDPEQVRGWLATAPAASPEALRLLAASVEARTGRPFDDDPGMRAAFEARPWYVPNPGWGPQLLANDDREAARLLRAAAAASEQGEPIAPPPSPAPAPVREEPTPPPAPQRPALARGYLVPPLSSLPATVEEAEAWWERSRAGGADRSEVRLQRNSYFARQGYVFHSPELREHFEADPDYLPQAGARSTALNAEERRIVALLRHIEAGLPAEAPAPQAAARAPSPPVEGIPAGFLDDEGEIPRDGAGAEAWVAAALGRGASLREVRAMRNALFAAHGRPFRTRWLRELFRSKEWYREDPTFSPSRLSAGEKEAVQVLAGLEEELTRR
jgi:hypothetical protein